MVITDFNIPLQTLYKMMRMRWDIENSLFNKLKTYSALEHCFVHHPNAIEAILYLMSIACNLNAIIYFQKTKWKGNKEINTRGNSKIAKERALSIKV